MLPVPESISLTFSRHEMHRHPLQRAPQQSSLLGSFHHRRVPLTIPALSKKLSLVSICCRSCCLSHPTEGKVLPAVPASKSRSQQASNPRTLHLAAFFFFCSSQPYGDMFLTMECNCAFTTPSYVIKYIQHPI